MSWPKGGTVPDDVRAKISAAKKGIPLSLQHREALKKPKSDQHKQNISKTRKALGLRPSPTASSKGGKVAGALASERARREGFPNLDQTGKIRSTDTRLKQRQSKINFFERGGHYPRRNTSIELMVQSILSERGIVFISSKPLLGKFIVDIFVPSCNLVIECDGSYWHSLPGMPERDRARDIELTAAGYGVLRLPETEIVSGEAAKRLEEYLKQPS